MNIPYPGEILWLSSNQFMILDGDVFTPARVITADHIFFDHDLNEWIISFNGMEFYAEDCRRFDEPIFEETLGILD